MNSAMGAIQENWKLDEASVGSMRIKRPTWRQRLGRWVAGEPDSVIVHMGTSAMSEGATKEKSAAMNEIEGGFRFRIIPASNGKIIGYYPMPRGNDDAISMRIQSRPIGEQLYVLKEGEDLLGAIAACLALDRFKPS